MNIAERSLFILTARLLWACQFEHKLDANGKEIRIPEYDYVPGFNTQPEPFQFDAKPRSEKRLKVIREAYEESRRSDLLLNRRPGQRYE
jgi:hypothetical protein